MSDVQDDKSSIKDKLVPLQHEARSPRDWIAEDINDLMNSNAINVIDDVIDGYSETTKVPVIKRLQQASYRTPLLFQSLQMDMDKTWFASQETWMLPVIPGPAKASKQASIPTPQEVKSEQTSAGAQSYLSLALDMVKSSGIYAVGALASPLVSLILTPFLAHNLSTNDYGGLAVLYTVVDLVTVMTQLGLSSAFFRAYNGDYESAQDRLGVLASSIILLLLVSLPIAIVMMITAPWLSVFLFNSSAFTEPVRLTALVIVLRILPCRAFPGYEQKSVRSYIQVYRLLTCYPSWVRTLYWLVCYTWA